MAATTLHVPCGGTPEGKATTLERRVQPWHRVPRKYLCVAPGLRSCEGVDGGQNRNLKLIATTAIIRVARTAEWQDGRWMEEVWWRWR